ncbi:MAG: dihydrofolate reductase [Myxococcales bacterium]|nr:dihydrofolate reductase [Myxococcales bacterium]MCB9708844.1 dihydrofolate reductase [Myxococcales bacterium]
MSRAFSIVAALDQEGGIGKNGTLPWHIPADLKHFRDITTGASVSPAKNLVIMGRRTFQSLPAQVRPLPRRINVVITTQPNLSLPGGVLTAHSIAEALSLEEPKHTPAGTEAFVIGGAQIYELALQSPWCKALYLTRIKARYACDVFFPPIPAGFSLSQRSEDQKHDGLCYWFETYLQCAQPPASSSCPG